MQIVCPECGTKNRVPDERVAEQPVCGRCRAAIAPHAPVALGDDALPAYLEGTEAPVVADFWAEWCAPCRMMAPQFEQAARDLPGVRFIKVDTELAPRSSVRHRIRSIPTLILFLRGEEVARVSGAMNSRDLAAWIRTHAPRPEAPGMA